MESAAINKLYYVFSQGQDLALRSGRIEGKVQQKLEYDDAITFKVLFLIVSGS
jgi:hypothetical protein